MKKGILNLLISCMILLTLVGCSRGNKSNSNENTNQQTSTIISSNADTQRNSSSEQGQDNSATKNTTDAKDRITVFDGGGIVKSRDGLSFPLGNPVPSSNLFNGTAYMSMLISNDNVFNVPSMSNVTFEPAARNVWHSHMGGQILLVNGGVGYYQEEGKPAQILRKGDVVMIPPGIKHWHGATPNSWFSHIAIATNPKSPGFQLMGPVTDEEYNTLKTEEFAGRTKSSIDNNFMFPKGNPMKNANFTGTIYLSTILRQDDVYNSPTMSYVVFEPSVGNNWHIHAGGQILIATDGIGYHQIEGEPVQVLYPGDVALCPPNKKHWHGAGPDGYFAHIAIETNPGAGGVQWLEAISDEEYKNLPKSKD